MVLMEPSHTSPQRENFVQFSCFTQEEEPSTALLGRNSYPVHSLRVILVGEHKLESFLCRYFRFEEHPVHLQTCHSTGVPSAVCILTPGLAGDYFTRHPLCDSDRNFLRNQNQPLVPLLSNSAWLSHSACYKYCCSFQMHWLPVRQSLSAYFCSGVVQRWVIGRN